jgi:hypothetical protein
MEQRFFTGTVNDYTVLIEYGSEHVVIFKADGMTFDLQAGQTVPGIADFMKKAKDLRLGWGQFPDDGDEVIYLYDRGDSNFGYAVNMDDPQCSEWGYAPF